jgi:hypothetical protein
MQALQYELIRTVFRRVKLVDRQDELALGAALTIRGRHELTVQPNSFAVRRR